MKERIKIDFMGIATLVSALGVIILGVLTPILNHRLGQEQVLLENRLQVKIEEANVQSFQEAEEYSKDLVDHYATIYAHLWNLLFTLNADRICIVQPHPFDNSIFISQTVEVLNPNTGASSEMERFQYRRISDNYSLVDLYKNNDFLLYPEASKSDVPILSSLFLRRGVKTACFYRLIDSKGRWRGNIAVDWLTRKNHNKEFLIEAGRDAVKVIAEILPEFK